MAAALPTPIPDDIAQVLTEIEAGDVIGLAQAGRLLGGADRDRNECSEPQIEAALRVTANASEPCRHQAGNRLTTR
ncbi:MAG: hypothetical protein K2P78_01685, partial [Gemmataceae bacterium]|nr:hypothetical protein [Gemmataceae bacterium]